MLSGGVKEVFAPSNFFRQLFEQACQGRGFLLASFLKYAPLSHQSACRATGKNILVIILCFLLRFPRLFWAATVGKVVKTEAFCDFLSQVCATLLPHPSLRRSVEEATAKNIAVSCRIYGLFTPLPPHPPFSECTGFSFPAACGAQVGSALWKLVEPDIRIGFH